MSKTKIEQKAITKVRELVDDIEFFKPLFNENDRGISWDGTIEMYHGNIDKKSNYDYTIDVQIKGRTTPTKKLRSKHRFSLDRIDLQNYLKKDGTLLLVCIFRKDCDEYKIYYASLLPYNIRKLLQQYSISKIKIDLKEITSAEQLESICRNFKLDKEIQKGINENIFNQENLTSDNGKVSKFYLWDKDIQKFNPQTLVGTWKYIYTFDENNYVVNLNYVELMDLVENLNTKIYDKDREIFYNDVKLETFVGGQKILFGKAFNFDLSKKTFNIKICGKLSERINQLEFIDKMFKYGFFLINGFEFKIETEEKEKKRFKELLIKYINLDKFLKNHNISYDINFDEWEDYDFNRLNFWISAIEEKKEIKLNSNISLIGSVCIKDIRLSIFARINKNKMFEVESLWNNNIANKYFFKYTSNLDEIETNNLFLILNSEAYLSNDINILEMQDYFKNNMPTDQEYIIMNMQVLEILKAYDINKNIDLLEYAAFLTQLLIKHDYDNPIYYINYCQILKREDKLTEKEFDKLISIKENHKELEIKLGCDLLLDNKMEIQSIIKRLDAQTLEAFKSFPISIYF